MSLGEAWTTFWTRPAEAGTCLPNAPAAINTALTALWAGFADELPGHAHVLDLACGNGGVAAQLVEARTDICVTGVDLARVPAHPHPRVELLAEVPLERLPFEAERFDAVVSQFGLEYAERAAAVAEAARVARPGALLCLCCHHAGGAIAANNAKRSAALRYVALESGLLRSARRAVLGSMTSGTQGFDLAAARRVAARFPDQSVARDFVGAVEVTMREAARRPPREVLQVLGELEARAKNELARVEALMNAALDKAGVAGLGDALRAAGFEAERPWELKGAQGEPPAAWVVRGLRS